MKRSLPLLFSLAVLAQPLASLAMNNKDVIKMLRAGLTEDTVLAAMQKEPAEYDTSTDGLIELKTAGVSEKVIQKMITLKSGGGAVAAAPAAGGGAPLSASAAVFQQEFPSIAPAKMIPIVGRDYFTRYTFREEKNEHSTTNYSRGNIIPINTPVKLVSMSGAKLVLQRLDNSQKITVENEPKFTKRDITEIGSVMLSDGKTPLEKLPTEVADAIRSGEIRKGMTRELAIMARGYPPAHETPSIEGDRWTYWSSRFVKQTIIFVNGRVSEGRGLY